jgi:hypothetical protein
LLDTTNNLTGGIVFYQAGIMVLTASAFSSSAGTLADANFFDGQTISQLFMKLTQQYTSVALHTISLITQAIQLI